MQAPVQFAVIKLAVLPNRPAGHALQAPAPPKLYCPDVQLVHVEALTEPTLALNVPALHGVQDTEALTLLKVPAGQSPEHIADVSPVAFPNRPALQLLQSKTPTPPTLNRPAGHITPLLFVEPDEQAYPGAATQLPEQLLFPSPGTAPKRPAGQGLHPGAPEANVEN